MGTKVWRVRVDVHTAVTVGFRFASGHPLAVYVLPAVAVSRAEVQEKGVHGVGVQTRHAHLQYWEHPPGERSGVCVYVCVSQIQHQNYSYCHIQTPSYPVAKKKALNKAQNIISSIQPQSHTVICINFRRALQTGHFAHFFFFCMIVFLDTNAFKWGYWETCKWKDTHLQW